MKKFIRITDIVLSTIVAVIMVFVLAGNYLLPDNVKSYSSKRISYYGIYSIAGSNENAVDFQQSNRVSSQSKEIKLFGIIPIKNAVVENSDTATVAVSGKCFGIKLYTDGVIVVGTRDVETSQGKVNPAKKAGIEKGDIIISINDVKMLSSQQVEEAFNDNNGKEYKLKIKRNGNYKSFTLKPAYSSAEGCYKVGIWVRDSTAGIGTITFFNESNGSLAALGHPVTDVDTNEIMPILKGEAVEARVTKLYKSVNGETGSLCCDFTNNVIGTLSVNSMSGVYGKYVSSIDGSKTMEVGAPQDIKRGEAKVLCTVGETTEAYDVEITRISYRSKNDEKNMVIRVTDERLLKKTGGIVQGMSGSPIIQDGKLVGALTHVMVDNPKKGYAIFAETMVEMSIDIN